MVNIIYGNAVLCKEAVNIRRELILRNDKCLKCVSLVRSVFLETGYKKCLALNKNIILPVNFCVGYAENSLDKWVNNPQCDKVIV